MKVLITGGLGYLGARLAHFLADKNYQEVSVGTRKNIQNIDSNLKVQIVNTQWNSVGSLQKICRETETIIHCAGMNSQDSMNNPVQASIVNGQGTYKLIQAAIKENVKRFVYISTAHVYSNELNGLITEKTTPNSTHPYSTSHLEGENIVISENIKGNIEGLVLRLSNAFGPPVNKNANCWMLVVNDLCRQLVIHNKIQLKTSGIQKRDFVTISDVCRAVYHLSTLPNDKIGDGLFNIGGKWNPSIFEMATIISDRYFNITGRKVEVIKSHEENKQTQNTFEYSISKLMNTGFKLDQNIDHEIDSLIHFCIKHFR
jgi:UDP-glucose 4-epimerase